MSSGPQMHDIVALLEARQVPHFESGQPLQLHRGQIGTVVMTYDDGVCEIEFSGRDGRTYAMLAIDPAKLIILHDSPEQIAA